MPDTMLDKYLRKKEALKESFLKNGATELGLWQYQELLYRISVLNTFQLFSVMAPISTDMMVLLPHYQMLDGFIECLTFERRFGVAANADMLKNRDAAHSNLLRVIQDYRNRFPGLQFTEAKAYKNEIAMMTMCVEAAWIQYRNVHVQLKNDEEATQ